MSFTKPFWNNLNYASTSNIREVMKFYNVGDKSFETDFKTILEQNFKCFNDDEIMVFLLAEKSKLITNVTIEFVYHLFKKRKNQLNSQTS